MPTSKDKIDAIFELRAAAETKALAEKALAEDPKVEKRDRLLAAQLTLAEKTMAAIEVCHECGHGHAQGQPHSV